MAARVSYIAGFSATSNVLAGQRFNIPISGTMAHSFVQAHDDEISAFARFAEANPGNVVLLIDTYETEAAAEKVVRLAPKLKQLGIDIQGVRIVDFVSAQRVADTCGATKRISSTELPSVVPIIIRLLF